eukprot:3491569-Prymnesium_polylepis.1
MLARLAPHERRIPHCPPCLSPAHRADRAARRAQTEHARARAAPPTAARELAAAPPRSRLKLRPFSQPNECVSRAGSGQTARTAAGSGREWRWAAAAHFFRPNLAPNWKFLSARADVTVPAASTLER